MRWLMAVALLLSLVSCSVFKPKEGQATTDYRKGRDGIVISFSEGTPPAKTYAGSEFNVILRVWNKGAYDNPNGMIFLGGFDPAAITMSPDNHPLPPILGSSQYMPQGGYDNVMFTAQNVNVLSGDSYTPTIMASACFYYQTLATPNVCIVPNPSELVKNRICEPKTITLQSQGGPVAVTRVEEEVMEGWVNFIITIQNVGGGNIVTTSSYSNCPWNLKYQDLDEVDAQVSIRSIGPGDCTPKGRVKLVDGKGVLSCKFSTQLGYDQANSYVTPLEIILDYAYNTNIKKDVLITLIPGTKPGP